MLWKELNFAQDFRFKRLHPALMIVIALCGYILFASLLTIVSMSQGTGLTAERVNGWVQVAGTSLACLMLLLIIFFAASSVSQEREWETLASLLTTPLERETILSAKWLASLWGVRQLGWWLGTVWAIGLVSGGLNVLAAPLLLAAWAVFAAFVASLGLYFSITCGSTQRATIAALLVCLLLGVGPWLLAGNSTSILTPPTILITLTFGYGTTGLDRILAALAWLPCYGAAAWGLWTLSCARFDK